MTYNFKDTAPWVAAVIVVCVGTLWWTWSHRPPLVPPPLSSTISAGGSHMLAIGVDGHIFGWGSGREGELGLLDTCFSRLPALTSGGPAWRSVHAGTRSSYAIATDGTLWRRWFGRQGCRWNLHLQPAYEPLNWNSHWLKVQEANGIVVGLDEKRALWFWQDFEVLPEALRDLGGRAEVPSLTKATGAQRWQDFCVALNTSYVVADDGTLWRNAAALKPAGAAPEIGRMIQVPAPVPFTRVFCREGGLHVLALDTEGKLWGFGDNTFGELADGNSGGRTTVSTAAIPQTPLQRVTEKRWQDVAVGQGFTVAIAADGSLWSWGNNTEAALGTGDQDNASKPQRVDDRHSWAAVAAGYHFAMGLTTDGAIYTWGTYMDGPVNDRIDTHTHKTPTQVSGTQQWAVPADPRPAQPHQP